MDGGALYWRAGQDRGDIGEGAVLFEDANMCIEVCLSLDETVFVRELVEGRWRCGDVNVGKRTIEEEMREQIEMRNQRRAQ